jgi:hypothetical protein
MALREFEDSNGMAWRVWSVSIDHAYQQSGREGYLGELQHGWLCFESDSDRRRLAKYPADWEALSEEGLCELLAQATPTPRRRLSGESEGIGS